MARANFVKKARKDIYKIGKMVTKVHKNGKNAGKEYSDRDRSQPDSPNDEILIHKGESYWWWQFAFSSKRISKTSPSRSQLTQSDFLSQVYELEDKIEGLNGCDPESLSDDVTSIIEDIRTLGEEQEEKQMNMPDHLQYDSPIGEMLGSRVESCEEWATNLENVDLDELNELVSKSDEEWESEWKDEGRDDEQLLEDYKQEKIDEQFEMVLEDLTSQMYEGE